jgi:hypothetical protein
MGRTRFSGPIRSTGGYEVGSSNTNVPIITGEGVFVGKYNIIDTLNNDNNIKLLFGTAVPVDNDNDVVGTGEGVAAPGSLYIRYAGANSALYVNIGADIDTPAWKQLEFVS